MSFKLDINAKNFPESCNKLKNLINLTSQEMALEKFCGQRINYFSYPR
ncbi:hypothetical protein NEOC65_001367 [Neochlamydia sp. AcF65]|nr:hypothetical protein [Neochlamydia sp. AcF65]